MEHLFFAVVIGFGGVICELIHIGKVLDETLERILKELKSQPDRSSYIQR